MHVQIRRSMAILLSATYLTVAGAAGTAFAQADPVVATIDGKPVKQSELTLAENELDPQFAQLPPEQKRAAALSALIEIKLAAAAAEKGGEAEKPDFKQRMDFLRLRALHSSFVEQKVATTVTDAAVRARYDKEIAAAPAQNEIRASHILVKTEDEAKAIIAQLDKGGDFAAIAKEKSTDGAAAQGGDLGYFGPGRMVPEFEQAAQTIAVGQHSKTPVQTQFGFHVIKVTDKRPQQPPAFEQIEPQLRSLMLREAYFQQVAELKKTAKVDVPDAELKKALDAIDRSDDAPAQQ